MLTNMFINGCSFLTPRPKDGVHTHAGIELASLLDMDIKSNLAMGGRGNERISFTTKLWFEQNGHKDTFALIGWSSMMRNDYITDDGWKKGRIPNMDLTWRSWKLTEQTDFIKRQTGWDIENTLIMKYLDNVLDLQNYFKLHHIPYVMYNSLPNFVNMQIKDFQTFSNAIDMKRFFSPEQSHLEYIQEKSLVVSPNDPHPSGDGHKQWAQQLKDYINVNNLRTV
tara:strand:+ start:15709 stop:16380 length:672 start_codon:yes stop_codon:yes gene_type:complete